MATDASERDRMSGISPEMATEEPPDSPVDSGEEQDSANEWTLMYLSDSSKKIHLVRKLENGKFKDESMVTGVPKITASSVRKLWTFGTPMGNHKAQVKSFIHTKRTPPVFSQFNLKTNKGQSGFLNALSDLVVLGDTSGTPTEEQQQKNGDSNKNKEPRRSREGVKRPNDESDSQTS
eukprot:gene19481-114_t